MKSNLKKDLSTLTTISETALGRLFDKIYWCISDTVEKAVLNKESVAEVDLGFGSLLINISNEEIKYKFVPNEKLEKAVSDTVINERNNLVDVLEENLVSKIVNVYKDMF